MSVAWQAIYQSGGQLNSWPYEHIVSWCMRNLARLRAETDMRALDIGCGAGNHSLFLAGLGFKVLAFDASSAVIDVARERAGEADIEFRVADIADIELPQERFAVAVDRLASSHTTPDTVARLYEGLWPALVPGGTVLTDLFSDVDAEMGLGARQDDGSYADFSAGTFQGLGRVSFFDENAIRTIFGRYRINHLVHVRRTDMQSGTDKALWQIEASR
jgi:SAM-dependent methyltransferase